MFDKIEKLKSKLNDYRPLTEGEVKRLREEFLIDFTYNSNAIEENTLILQETALIIKEGITIDKKPLKEHLESVGHKDAFYYVEELVKEKLELSEKIIKDIHTLVLMDKPQDRGVYRNILPQPYIVPKLMEQLIGEYKEQSNDMHVVEKVSLFHLKFKSIHPFIDGNGRTGRLILNLELMKEGYPRINIKFKDRRKYYDCFTDYHKNNFDPKMLVSLVAGYLEEELQRYV